MLLSAARELAKPNDGRHIEDVRTTIGGAAHYHLLTVEPWRGETGHVIVGLVCGRQERKSGAVTRAPSRRLRSQRIDFAEGLLDGGNGRSEL